MEAKLLNDILDRQFFYYDKKYEDVCKDPNWKSNYSLTRNQNAEWMEWGVNHLVSALKIDEKKAQMEMSWVQVSYGTDIRG